MEVTDPKDTRARRGLAPWSPRRTWTEMDRMFHELRRDMEEFFGRPRTWMPGGLAFPSRRPAVNIEDTGTSLVVTAEVPGVTNEDLDLNVTDHALEIRAQARTATEERREGLVHIERSASAFHRYVSLPEPVDPDGAEAHLEHGILRVEIPKRVPTRMRKVRVD